MKGKKSLFLYSLLWLQSLLFFYLAYKNKKNKAIIVHFFSLTGMAFLFEYVVLVLLKAYRYYPNLLKRMYFDNLLGSTISQFFIVPALATFITSFKLTFRWKLAFVFYLTGIEEVFKRLKTYRQFWWKTAYTGIFIMCFFYISDYLYQVFQRRMKNEPVKSTTIFLKTFTLYSVYMFYQVVLFNSYFFKVSWFKGNARSHVAFATLYALFVSTIYTILFVYSKRWLTVSGILLMLLTDIILNKLKVMKLKHTIPSFTVRRLLFFAWLWIVDRNLYE